MFAGLGDIAAEGVLLLGAGRAILLQIANPSVGRGVAEHSTFTVHPLERFRATATFLYAAVYGTPGQVAAVRRRVNRAHVPVRGANNGRRSGYSAFDPGLQLWVVATLYDSTVAVFEKVYGPLSEEEAEVIYRDYARIGSILQLPAGMWPPDRASFDAYWKAHLEMLEVDEDTIRVAHGLLNPRAGALPWWAAVCMPLVRLVTTGLLPEGLRASFRLPWNHRRQRLFGAFMRLLAVAYPPLPRRFRHAVKILYLRRLDEATGT